MRLSNFSRSKLPEGFREQLITTIKKTFQIQHEQAEQVYVELLQSIKKKDLVRFPPVTRDWFFSVAA